MFKLTLELILYVLFWQKPEQTYCSAVKRERGPICSQLQGTALALFGFHLKLKYYESITSYNPE